MNKVKTATLISIAIISIILAGIVSFEANSLQQKGETKASDKATKRTPALRSKVYEQLSRAQAAGDEGDITGAIDILDEVKEKSGSMNSYELAMMYNFYGFIYYNDENYTKALASFEQVVEQQPIPENFEKTTLFSLAQLHMMQGNYNNTITALERWEALNDGVIPPKNYILKAQAYYQNKEYEKSAVLIEQAIKGHEEAGYLPDEGWLILQRAIHYELKQPNKVKEVIAKLIRLYEQPKYWIQLAGMYGELGEEKKQLAIMETAYQQGAISSASDVFNLAQLYYYHQAPFKGALLMEQAMEAGTLERNLRNLKFLSQCWTSAKEEQKAVPVMRAAADLSDDGELDAQLGHLFYNLEDWEQAVDASKTALEKGGLPNPGAVHMVLGLSLYNQRNFVEALAQLAEAEKFPASRGAARQWSKFVEKDKTDIELLNSQI